MNSTQALAGTSYTEDDVAVVASVLESGDYAGSRIHLRTCNGKCGSLPEGWAETRTALPMHMARKRVNTVVAPCAAA